MLFRSASSCAYSSPFFLSSSACEPATNTGYIVSDNDVLESQLPTGVCTGGGTGAHQLGIRIVRHVLHHIVQELVEDARNVVCEQVVRKEVLQYEHARGISS